MAFSLGFTESFFSGDGDIYNVQSSDRPKSVLEAIVSMDKYNRGQFVVMVKKLFGVDIAGYTPDQIYFDILDRVRETDTCTGLKSPVTVYIDPEGDYTVDVYD